MRRPVLDDFDRWVFSSNTYVGKSVRRKYKLIKILRYVDKRNKRRGIKRVGRVEEG